jgi:nucleotide-binding universal stress UspA family protein
MTNSRKIVVGIDGSEGAKKALRWAVSEAQLRSAAIEVIHVWNFSPLVDPIGGIAYVPMDDLLESAQAVAANTVKSVEDVLGDTRITTKVEQGSASQALLKAAVNADLLVVGRRGHGGFIGLLIGSTAEQVAHHAPCPVVIVPS